MKAYVSFDTIKLEREIIVENKRLKYLLIEF